MEIYRKSLLRYTTSLQNAKSNSVIFQMTEDDIQNDNNNICDIVSLSDSNEILVTFQNINYDWNERYCYIHLKEYYGLDGVTKAILIKTFVIEESLIDVGFIKTVLIRTLKQYQNGQPNRIFIGNRNYGLHYEFQQHIWEIAKYVVDLYNAYTSNSVDSYHIDDCVIGF